MHVAVISDLVTGRGYAPDDFRMSFRTTTRQEKGGSNLILIENIQDLPFAVFQILHQQIRRQGHPVDREEL